MKVDEICRILKPDYFQTDVEDLRELKIPAHIKVLPVVRFGRKTPNPLPGRMLFEGPRAASANWRLGQGRGTRAPDRSHPPEGWSPQNVSEGDPSGAAVRRGCEQRRGRRSRREGPGENLRICACGAGRRDAIGSKIHELTASYGVRARRRSSRRKRPIRFIWWVLRAGDSWSAVDDVGLSSDRYARLEIPCKRVYRAASLLQVAHAPQRAESPPDSMRIAQSVSGRRPGRSADDGNVAANSTSTMATNGLRSAPWPELQQRPAALPGPANAAANNWSRNSLNVGAAAPNWGPADRASGRPVFAAIRVHRMCQHSGRRRQRRALHANARNWLLENPIAYICSVGQTPTRNIANSEPRFSAQPWSPPSAQVTNWHVFSVTNYTGAFTRR